MKHPCRRNQEPEEPEQSEQPVTEALDRLQALIAHSEDVQTVLRMLADWAEDTGVYDPMGDRYAIRVPGDLVRRIRELADH